MSIFPASNAVDRFLLLRFSLEIGSSESFSESFYLTLYSTSREEL
jgi:hypothetical protein